jgi:hypothetical protein
MFCFVQGATVEEAQELIAALDLSFNVAPWGVPLTALVAVPVDSEDHWASVLRTYAIVKSAGRIMVTTTS